MNFNVNFNILKQFNCALVGLIKDLLRCVYVTQHSNKQNIVA